MMASAEKTLSPTPLIDPLSIGEIAVELLTMSAAGDLLFVSPDEQQAMALLAALSGAKPVASILFCPSSDALPGDASPASPANVGRRVSTLRAIRRLTIDNEKNTPIICVTTGEALGRLYPHPAAFDAAPPRVQVGQAVDLAALFEQLQELGYIVDERVDEPGEVALRSLVLDVYPADAAAPLRIEASDGTVTVIRRYDPVDQRTTETCERYELGRVSEPALAGNGVTLLEHLPKARIILPAAADVRRKQFLKLAADMARRQPDRALRDIAIEEVWQRALAAHEVLVLEPPKARPPRFVEEKQPERLFKAFAKQALADGKRLVLLGTERDLRFLSRRVAKALKRDVDPACSWNDVAAARPGAVFALAMPVDRGFGYGDIVAISAADLLGSRAERGDLSETISDTAIFALGEIRVGDVVVHEDYGIGIVQGLAPMPDLDGADQGDAIVLAYANDGVRLVPVADADRIWRYGAEADAVTLDKLDGTSWKKKRGAIEATITESAQALSALAAERSQHSAPVLDPPAPDYERFSAGFPFSETSDQARAIAAVRDDLAAGKPMDRLIVGDVGYGKTEVALRAAAIAALAGRQVAIAAPTTVLARQHLETFTQRFEGTRIAVASLSRLSSPADKRLVKKGLADGSIAIVVGTGAIAGKGVAYKDLALVIVDEEQRFGVADKARMRDMGAGHVLSLSATPIPRTLQSALIGLQQLSVIATPPARRRPIRTSVMSYAPEAIRAALLREKSRGGQSFVVVPRIADMAPIAGQLARLVPEMVLVQAHGKMKAVDIDDTMVGFARGDGDVLLATNIIEAGLDVPRANTMLIWRADRFGLSQLHQLRGRVGRGSRRGHVLLITDAQADIAPRTLKRLRTLEAFDRLGAGFSISARDLDMRGAGDLLGDAQAGHMKLIGVDLYQHLFERALRASHGEAVERWTPELNLGVAGRLPASWLPDEELRVTLYCRLARLEGAEELTAFAEEIEDRFGALPPEAETLLSVAAVRVAARKARIARIDAGPAAIALTPRPDFAGHGVAELTVRNDRLLAAEKIDEPLDRLNRVQEILDAVLDG